MLPKSTPTTPEASQTETVCWLRWRCHTRIATNSVASATIKRYAVTASIPSIAVPFPLVRMKHV